MDASVSPTPCHADAPTASRRIWIASLGLLSIAVGCGSSEPSAPSVALASTPAEIVAAPIETERLQRCIALLASVPETSRPAFTPTMTAFSGRGMSSAALIEAHRNRYRAALQPDQHAATWQRDPTLAAALRQNGLSGLDLAKTLTQASCAHQASRLLDLNELRADAAINLTRLAADWDAGGQDEIDRLALEQAIGELVALQEYLDLLANVPQQNQTIAQQHWGQLEAFLPAVELRDQLERIIETDAARLPSTMQPIQQVSGQQPVQASGQGPVQASGQQPTRYAVE